MRHLFVTNTVTDEAGNTLRSREGACYDSRENALAGVNPLVDLLDVAGEAAIGAPATNSAGNAIFYGPDGVDAVWVSFGYGVWFVPAADLGDRIAALEAQVAELVGQPVFVRASTRPSDPDVLWLNDPNAEPAA